MAARYVAPEIVFNATYVGLACCAPLSLLHVALVLAAKVDRYSVILIVFLTVVIVIVIRTFIVLLIGASVIEIGIAIGSTSN